MTDDLKRLLKRVKEVYETAIWNPDSVKNLKYVELRYYIIYKMIIEMKYSRKQTADMLGVDKRTVTRALKIMGYDQDLVKRYDRSLVERSGTATNEEIILPEKKEKRRRSTDPRATKLTKEDIEKVDEIIEKLSSFYGVSREEIEQPARKKGDVTKVRQFIYYKLVNDWGWTITKAGLALKRDAWSAADGVKRFKEAVSKNKDLMKEYQNIIGED